MGVTNWHNQGQANIGGTGEAEKIKELESKMEEEKINNQLLIAELFEMMTGGTLDA